MPISEELTATDPAATAVECTDPLSCEMKSLLERAYGMQFTIFDGASGDVLGVSPWQPARDWSALTDLCLAVARRGQPEFIEDEDPFLTLAVPLVDRDGREVVAAAVFLTRRPAEKEDISRQARQLGIDPTDARNWSVRQPMWTPESLKHASDIVLDDARTRSRVRSLQQEADSLSTNLAATYEEISLLYRLTRNLKLSKSDEDLGRAALEWMEEVVPASGLAIQLFPAPNADKPTIHAVRHEAVLLTRGECPIDSQEFSALLTYLDVPSLHRPIVLNRSVTAQPGWPLPRVRQMVAVALVEGENIFGWLLAVNHAKDGEFGTVEASLLSSVAAILGIHSGNIELYRQQANLLAGIVRALTSAIDAKDPYTCGHSDRVARVAVCLAEELGCDAKMVDTLYLAGQLHDIGKIGVNDSVLRKAGVLSDAEYEHIKQHVNIGQHILNDLAKLEDVLPVVLHHHESWDGGGYPNKLGYEQIPLAARIVAVADAFDAMSSDRPYRKRMPDAKVDEILRTGAGHQWDPMVVDAYFRVCDDIRRVYREAMRATQSPAASQPRPLA
jgi:hypothetical protein